MGHALAAAEGVRREARRALPVSELLLLLLLVLLAVFGLRLRLRLRVRHRLSLRLRRVRPRVPAEDEDVRFHCVVVLNQIASPRGSVAGVEEGAVQAGGADGDAERARSARFTVCATGLHSLFSTRAR